MKIHRIVVAHGASNRCKQELGGSGSLMINTSLIGNEHYEGIEGRGVPFFTVGRVDHSKGFVHVLDDTTLDVLLKTLDTISDFVAYLQKKEDFLRSGRNFIAAGEEELLAFYLGKMNRNDEHNFVVPKSYDVLGLDEGFWEEFINSPARRSQLEADQISYIWDSLIESFSKHILDGTQYFTSHTKISDNEIGLRFLARESRFQRRMLSKILANLIEENSLRHARVMSPITSGEPYYIFLVMSPVEPFDEYRAFRGYLLNAYSRVVKLKYPDATDIIGIATESGADGKGRSEDFLYFDARLWSEEDNREASSLQSEYQLLIDVNLLSLNDDEYPRGATSRKAKNKLSDIGRNSPCPCGSGKKYKRCCMRKMIKQL